NLVTKRIISEYKDKFESYELSSNFDLPFDATDKLISSIADIPLRKKEIDKSQIDKPRVDISLVSKNLVKLWGNLEIISTHIIYLPIWNISLMDSNYEQRDFFIEAINGNEF
ncbi:MAG: hypothetical protein V1824_02470, partial [archaeon]